VLDKNVLDEAVLGDSLEEVAEANEEVAVERAASTGFRTRVVDALDEIAPINIASPLCNESSSGCSSADSFLVFRKRGKLSQANAQMPQTRSRIGLGQPMPAPVNLRALLAQGKCAFSLGRVPEAVTLIEAQPRLFPPAANFLLPASSSRAILAALKLVLPIRSQTVSIATRSSTFGVAVVRRHIVK